jgi:hypothetical protein
MPVKEAAMRRLAEDDGVSVVFLGSSTMDAAADPSLSSVGRQRGSYNASVGAGSLAMIDVWGRLLAVPVLRPDVVVVGIVSRELNPNDPEQRSNEAKFFDSKAVHRLTGDERFLERVERRAADLSALVEYRSVLRQPSRVIDALRGDEFRTGEFGEIVADDGQYEGFLEARFRGGPESTANIRARSLRDFEIGAGRVEILRRLLRFVADQGIDVIVVNMPVTDDYVSAHPNGAADYERAVDVVRRETDRAGATFLDIGVWPDELFADVAHVNAEGSRQFMQVVDDAIGSLAG